MPDVACRPSRHGFRCAIALPHRLVLFKGGLGGLARKGRSDERGGRGGAGPAVSRGDRGPGRERRDPRRRHHRGWPAAAGQFGSPSRRHRLPRSRQLPDRARPHGGGAPGSAHLRRDRSRGGRRGPGARLRLRGAAAGNAGPAGGALGGSQSEELDRTARHLHPAHHGRQRGLRPSGAGLSGPALRGGVAAFLQRARPLGLEAQPDPVPPRRARGGRPGARPR